MIKGLQYPSYEERLREPGLCSLEEGRLWGHTVVAFQYLKGPIRETGTVLLARACGDRTRGQVFKPEGERFKLDRRKTPPPH